MKTRKLSYYSKDLHPFEIMILYLYKSSNEYHYGLQGQERDDKVKEVGNSVNYKYIMHEPRIEWLKISINPLS